MSIILQNINKHFEDFKIQDVSFNVGEGEYFVILGPSGAGKTVILEIIAGLLAPDSGQIYGTEDKRKGLIYQDYMLFPHLNVFDNISYGLKITKLKKELVQKHVQDIAERLEIIHLLGRDVSTLSGGEKQRVAIARAMIIKPEVYLFDEPTAALDRNARIKTQQMFLKLHKETNATFIHVTHDFEEALSLGDRIAILSGGKILQSGLPDDVFNNPQSKEIADFLGYRNVFGGEIKNNKMVIKGTAITVPETTSAFGYVAIRSDDIIISEKRLLSSARNSLAGLIKEVIKKPSIVEVIMDIGFPLTIEITRKSYQEMNIKPGGRFWATFKVSAIKVFEHK
jgi:molybdopterin-binding protein